MGTHIEPLVEIGSPKDVGGAEALAKLNRHQFEYWALDTIEAQPAQDRKKGSDKGVDGYIFFKDDESGKFKKIVVQVKSGHASVDHIRDLKGELGREKAEIEIYLTLEPPTKPMKEEAAAAGFYKSELFEDNRYPRVQILTIEEIFAGKQPVYPQLDPDATFKAAPLKGRKGEQKTFL